MEDRFPPRAAGGVRLKLELVDELSGVKHSFRSTTIRIPDLRPSGSEVAGRDGSRIV
jgi:hypothetical protein